MKLSINVLLENTYFTYFIYFQLEVYKLIFLVLEIRFNIIIFENSSFDKDTEATTQRLKVKKKNGQVKILTNCVIEKVIASNMRNFEYS